MKKIPLSYQELNQVINRTDDQEEKFRILIVDDNPYDSELVVLKLKQSKIKFESKIVADKSSYEDALRTFLPDVVYCDFNISLDFNAVTAIRMLKENYSDVPFVLVTGALNEQVASMCFSEGIDDYVLKSNMNRLPISLINSISKRKIELQKKEAYEKLVKAETQVRNFATHLNQILEEERYRIAREIHDELGQQLTGLKMDIFLFKKLLNKPNTATTEKINGMTKSVDVIIQSVRKIATELRPGILDTLGLVPSIEWLGKEFEKKTRVKCKLDLNVKDQKFEKNISTCFFRICQESLTNVSKHSGASRVFIKVSQENNDLILKVSDNGRGIASEQIENPFSIGLVGMRERANIIDADLLIMSRKNAGTTVQLKSKLK
jgi:signal transduction histidine kinase